VADELVGTKADLTDGDTSAVIIVARSLNHLTVTDIDSNVVDARSGRTEEDKITSSLIAERLPVAAIIVLALCIVDDGLASALIDRVLGETTAIETNDITIIAIGGDVLLDTIGGTVIISATPAVRVLVDHTLGGRGDLRTTVSLGAHSKSD